MHHRYESSQQVNEMQHSPAFFDNTAVHTSRFIKQGAELLLNFSRFDCGNSL